MSSKWWPGAGFTFDLETTHPEPEEARVVTACLVEIDASGAKPAQKWLVNPGIEIPAGAVEIHGITNEVAATGMEAKLAVHQIARGLELAWRRGLPIIIMVANYDLTVIHHELLRYGLPPLELGPIIDPFVIDRGTDRYRKGKRNLGAIAAHYGCKQEGAHTAEGDALAAARIVWKMAQRNVRGYSTLTELQGWQRTSHRERQEDYARYLRDAKKPDEAARVCMEWPIREAPSQPPAPYVPPQGEIF